MKDLNKLSKDIYEANKAKGFHEEKHSEEHMMCLVVSELMEAVEADRKGRKANLKAFYDNGACERYLHNENYKEAFEKYIKDTVADELADAVIRLLDTAGALGVDANLFNTNLSVFGNSFTENIYDIFSGIVMNNANISIPYGIGRIEKLCSSLNIDLWQHVDLKLKYNSLRPYKHGKQY